MTNPEFGQGEQEQVPKKIIETDFKQEVEPERIDIGKVREENPEMSVEEESAVEEIEGEAKKKEDAREQKRARALEILSDPEVMDRNPEEVEIAFSDFTEDEFGHYKILSRQSEAAAYRNMDQRGENILLDETTLAGEEVIIEEQKRILDEKHSMATYALWQRNSFVKPEDREKFMIGLKEKLGLEGVDGDITFDKLINDGYAVEKAKIGWFSGEVKIPSIEKNGFSLLANQKNFLHDMSQRIKSEVFTQARISAGLIIREAQQRLAAEIIACKKILIEQAIREYNDQKKEAEISGVASFEELYGILDKGGKITGVGGGELDAKEQKTAIEKLVEFNQGRISDKDEGWKETLKEGRHPLFTGITRGGGLREKTLELLRQMAAPEKKKEKSVAKSKSKYKKKK